MQPETWGYSFEEKEPEIGEYFHFKLKRCPDPKGAFSCCGVGKMEKEGIKVISPGTCVDLQPDDEIDQWRSCPITDELWEQASSPSLPV